MRRREKARVGHVSASAMRRLVGWSACRTKQQKDRRRSGVLHLVGTAVTGVTCLTWYSTPTLELQPVQPTPASSELASAVTADCDELAPLWPAPEWCDFRRRLQRCAIACGSRDESTADSSRLIILSTMGAPPREPRVMMVQSRGWRVDDVIRVVM